MAQLKMINSSLYPRSTDFCTLDYRCSYLPNKDVRMFYKYIEEANKSFLTAVIQRGWRRFGNYYFYPICKGCNACKSLRIDVENFKATKSQRRVIRKNVDTKVSIVRPKVTSNHLELYNKYHRWKSGKDDWNFSKPIGESEYFENFVEGAWDFGKEVCYYRDGKLVGVDLIDILDDGISAIYFFYDPDYANLSLGIYSLLYQIHLARRLKLKYIYLGYWVDGCKAFAYKPKFAPQEILEGFPEIDEEPRWRAFCY